MKKIFLIILAAVSVATFARADAPVTTNSFYYLFHLYYDHGKLTADRDFQFNYDVIPGDYVPDQVTSQTPYRGEIVNVAGEVAAHFTFDPQQGDAKFVQGKVSVKAPYVADAQNVIFYNAQDQQVFSISVAASSYCNDDGVCDSNRGEDSLSCPKDCKQSLPAPPSVSSTPTPSASSSGLISGLIYTIIGILLLIVIWWLFRHRKPPQPQNSLPTPTPPPSAGNKV